MVHEIGITNHISPRNYLVKTNVIVDFNF